MCGARVTYQAFRPNVIILYPRSVRCKSVQRGMMRYVTDLRAAGGVLANRADALRRANETELNDLSSLAVAGDDSAVDSLIREVRPMVLRYCRAKLSRVSGYVHYADDVAQEVCIALLAALPRYEDMGRPFAAFVFGIAAHKVADALRRST